jgi:DNA-binding transcriptional ArsR family regulator
MTEFTPLPVLVVETSEQLKAFTDPLRVRVLSILTRRSATNQQISDLLGEPHAKVLYHIRFLLEVELIRLINTQIKGGNIEKYYRAVASVFDLRSPAGNAEQDIALLHPILDNLRSDLISSAIQFPDFVNRFNNRSLCLTQEQLEEFDTRLNALITEMHAAQADANNPKATMLRFTSFLYCDPREEVSGEDSA